MTVTLRFITHLETFSTNAQFHRLVAGDIWAGKTPLAQMTDERMPHKTLLLRVQNDHSLANWLDDLPMHDQPEFEKWKTLRGLLSRARRAIAFDPILGPMVDPTAPLGRVVISVLQPRSPMMWHSDLGEYAKRHLRFHVVLVTNPRCHLHCGGDTIHAPQGALVHLNALEQHCATNFGEAPRAHLIFELRRRDMEAEDATA